VTRAIEELNPRKALGVDKVTARVLQELSRKANVFLIYIFNGILRLQHSTSPMNGREQRSLSSPNQEKT